MIVMGLSAARTTISSTRSRTSISTAPRISTPIRTRLSTAPSMCATKHSRAKAWFSCMTGRCMKRTAAFFGVIVGLGLLIGCASLLMHRIFPSSHPYSVAQVQDGVRHDRHAWVGQVVLVHGVIVGCPPGYPCPLAPVGTTGTGVGIASAHTVPLTQALPLGWEPQNPVLLFLRHIPLVNRLMPAPQGLDMKGSADYHVRLVPLQSCRVMHSPCVEARLLDAEQMPQVH